MKLALFLRFLRGSIRIRQCSRTRVCIFLLLAGSHPCVWIGNQQATAQTMTVSPSASDACTQGPTSEAPANCLAHESRLFGGVEYLLWWVKGAPLSAPLVSTGPAANDEGFLVNSDTTILYGAPFAPAKGGNDTQNFGGLSGSRLTLGYLLDEDRHLAAEARVFMLESGSAGFEAQGNSTALGSSGIRIPVFNTVPYTPGSATDLTVSENGLPVAIPGIIAGKVVIANSLRLWGTDATALFKVYQSSQWELNALAGFSYLDLSEGFGLTDSLVGLSGPFAGQSGTVSDHFGISNQFYGAAVGLRGRASWGPVSVSLTGRVALGSSHEVLNISGAFQAVNFTASSGPQGIFAQPSNSGSRSSNVFAVVPEVEVKLGFDLTPAVRLTLGYDFLYYSSVVRPGDQIDRNLPKGQVFEQGGSSVSATSPSALFNKTGFVVQGLSAGVRLRF